MFNHLITYSDNGKTKGTTLIICYLKGYTFRDTHLLLFAGTKICESRECEVDRKTKYQRNCRFLAFAKLNTLKILFNFFKLCNVYIFLNFFPVILITEELIFLNNYKIYSNEASR